MTGPTVFPATQTLTVVDPLCGHLPNSDECNSGCAEKCAYWRGVASGEYHSPDAYLVDGVFTIPPHAPGLLPLTDPALRPNGRAA